MDDFGGSELKAAVTGETVNDEVWDQLVGLAGPLLQTIRGTFRAYTTAFDDGDCVGVLHSTFAQIILKIDQYDPARPLLPWARSIARHLVVDVLRDRTLQGKIVEGLRPTPALVVGAHERGEDAQKLTDGEAQSDDDFVMGSPGTKEQPPQYAYEYGEDSHLGGLPKTKIFQQELALLTDEEQEFVIDHWGNGVPLVDLARRAGVSDVAMRKRAERVRRKLYEGLIRHAEFKGLELTRGKKSLPSK